MKLKKLQCFGGGGEIIKFDGERIGQLMKGNKM